MQVRPYEPEIFEAAEGWLATTPRDHPYRIGVVGESRAEAGRDSRLSWQHGRSFTGGPSKPNNPRE